VVSQPQSAESGQCVKTPGRAARWVGLCWRLVRKAILACALAVGVAVFTPAGDWWAARLIHVDTLQEADYIVVLGGNGERAVEAADLYRSGWGRKVIISSSGESTDELAGIAAAYGVPRDAIICDRAARNTWEHPRTIALLPDVDRQSTRLLVVTSSLHTSRAAACFRRDGYRHVSMQVPGWQIGGLYGPTERSWLAAAEDLPVQLRETLAWAFYKLAHGI